ncbi:MAG: transcriptional regulator NrdR [Actinomycetota bacterium]
MQCPFCLCTNSRVLESRSAEAGQSIRRRRECLNCQHRFTTYERIEFVPVTVIKRDGKRESFDKSKLLRGIVRACEKTGVAASHIEALVDEIESELQGRSLREVTSSDIGEMVLKQLPALSEVAYVRFASVYRQFRGIRDFVETLRDLENTPTEVVNSLTTSTHSQPPTVEASGRETQASCPT